MVNNLRATTRRSLFLFTLLFLGAVLTEPVLALDASSTVSISISVPVSSSSTPTPTDDDDGEDNNTTASQTANVSLSGFAYPFALLTFLKNGAVIGTDTAGPGGTFTREFLTAPEAGTFSVWARDQNNLISPTVSLTFTILNGSLVKVGSLALPPTIAHAPIGSDGSLLIYGSAYPGSVVRIFNNINTYAAPLTVTARADGRWEYRLIKGSFNDRNFSYKANYQYESLGIISPFSNILELRLPTCRNSDFDGDGVVNLTDFSILLFYWGRIMPQIGVVNQCVDRNQDSIVDLQDFSILMYEWTPTYSGY